MTKNPFANAAAAALYIILVASVMFYGGRLADDGPDTIIAPIAILSLFTLSAAVMGYLFLYQPLRLYLDGKKTEAASLFVRTLGAFAILTALFVAVLFSGIL